jgi:site-specific recombinase XerD
MDQVVVCGPLGEHVAGLRAELTRTGYTESSSRDIVRAMARLSSWLEDNGLMPSELTPQVVDEFLLLRREYSSVEGVARRGLGPALRFLRDIGVVPSRDEVADGTPIEVLLTGYRGWLADERALAAESVRCYCCQARTFLRWLPEPLDEALAHLDAPTVTTFIVEQSAVAGSVWSAKALVTSVRSLLRFLHVRGLISVPLTAAVPAVAGWRLSGLPRALDAGHVDALLAGCDTTVPVGLRDHTILIMLARLGLRGAEVAALGLDDVDWRSGEIVVRGKGSRVERLPLAVEVGTAMATYLTRGRAHCDCPTLFVTVRAPYQALSGSTIRAIMGRACQRAGLPRVGAHRLRHSLATDLLRSGASLTEIGQVLRHRSQLSTAVYAKVDHSALRRLARPWPGSTR